MTIWPDVVVICCSASRQTEQYFSAQHTDAYKDLQINIGFQRKSISNTQTNVHPQSSVLLELIYLQLFTSGTALAWLASIYVEPLAITLSAQCVCVSLYVCVFVYSCVVHWLMESHWFTPLTRFISWIFFLPRHNSFKEGRSQCRHTSAGW